MMDELRNINSFLYEIVKLLVFVILISIFLAFMMASVNFK